MRTRHGTERVLKLRVNRSNDRYDRSFGETKSFHSEHETVLRGSLKLQLGFDRL